jgi:hypothetical protein
MIESKALLGVLQAPSTTLIASQQPSSNPTGIKFEHKGGLVEINPALKA